MLKFIATLLVSSILSAYVYADQISLCTAEENQYPNIWRLANKPIGIYLEIFNKISLEINTDFNFVFYPWQRCLEEAKNGNVQGVISASYKADRAEYLEYPDDAKSETEACSSKLKLECGEYVLVTLKSANYVYEGEFKDIPGPVRGARGYSILNDIKNSGVNTETSFSEEAALKKLVRDQNGSAAVTGMGARELLKRSAYADLEIQVKPLVKKSYFTAFSKKSSIPKENQEKIWSEISKIVEVPVKINKIIEKYSDMKAPD